MLQNYKVNILSLFKFMENGASSPLWYNSVELSRNIRKNWVAVDRTTIKTQASYQTVNQDGRHMLHDFNIDISALLIHMAFITTVIVTVIAIVINDRLPISNKSNTDLCKSRLPIHMDLVY